jgi:hypothetical protein
MNSIFTFLLIAGIAAAVVYTLLKTRDAKTKKKAQEVKDSQVNPIEKVDGLPYDTSEVDPTKR